MKDDVFPGQALKERREKLNLAAEEVYREIRIPPEYLRAIEEGDFIDVPAPCYALGYLRTYCEFLGFDPEPFVDAFRTCTRPANGFLRMPRRDQAPAPRWWSEFLAWAAVCAVLALAWLAYAVAVNPQPEENEGRVEAITVDMVVPPAPETPRH